MEQEFSKENGSSRVNDFDTSGKHTENTENDSSTKIDTKQLFVRTPPHSLIVRVLALCFGISAQAGVSGLFNELPLLINTAPEGAKLPSYFVVTMQLANVTAVVYLIAKKLFKRTRDSLWIVSLFCSAIVSMILLALYHDVTTRVGNSRYSLVLLALVFVIGSLKSSSQVLMVPFMRNFHKKDMVSFFIGLAAGSSLIGIISLFQGNTAKNCTEDGPVVVSNINFSMGHFLFFIESLYVVSLVAFLMLLHYRSTWENSKVDNRTESMGESDDRIEKSTECIIDRDQVNVISTLKKLLYYALLIMMPFFGTSFLDSMSPFASLPYGSSTYRMITVLGPLTELLTCIMTLWIIPLHRWLIKYIIIALISAYIYIVCLALSSPNVPLVNSHIGQLAILTAYFIVFASVMYVQLTIMTTFKDQDNSQALVYAGACVQFGEASGSIVGFIITNFTSIFEYHLDC